MAERYTHGMDVRRVRSIADRLAQAQRDLIAAQAASDGAARLLKEHWDGEDSASFAGRWPHLSSILETQAGAIKGLVQDLRAQADEQELASGGSDSDGDGVPDSRDRDADNDGTRDRQDSDDDNDGTPDRQDSDDDNDGTPDAEDDDRPGVKVDLPVEDRDGDGTPDSSEPDGTDPLDEDGDGTPDTEDADDDNDGTPDADDPEHGGEPKNEWNKTWEKEWVDNGPQHKADPRVDVSMELGSVEKELWDAAYAEKTFGDEDGTHLKVEALSTEGKAEGSWALDRDGLTTAGTVTAGAYLAKASGAWSNSHGTSASGNAYVGAEANAKGSLSLGLDGVKASAGGEVFVGGKAEASINQDFGPVDAGVGGEISYGIGAHAEADAEFSADRVGVSVDIGATLGIGGGIELDIGFDPPW